MTSQIVARASRLHEPQPRCIRPAAAATARAFLSVFFAVLPCASAQTPLSASRPAGVTADFTAAATLHDAIDAAGPAVVKLYGAGLGREHGYGSGVLVSADGRILTTLSLLINATEITAVLDDGRKFTARMERSDEYRQLALLRIDAEGLPFLTPAKSDHLQIGDTLLALGNWFKIAEGVERVSVNRGILSLKTHLDAGRLAQEFSYAGPVLVYDALTANPGAPGGAILDRQGRFVGLIGKLVEAKSTLTRINYALPGEELQVFLAEGSEGSRAVGLEGAEHPAAGDKNGSSAGASSDASASARPAAKKPPYVGIKLSTLGYRQVSAFVDRVRPGSPADQAGIVRDDLILAFNNRRISDTGTLEKAIAETLPGQQVVVVFKRGEKVMTVHVTVGEKP